MSESLISLTPAAIEKIKQFQGKKPENQSKLFRVYVEGGGCGGFQYGFVFDDEREGDVRVKCDDIEILLDNKSSLYIAKSVVDYVEDVMNAGFVVKNPQAKKSCGCGSSFTV